MVEAGDMQAEGQEDGRAQVPGVQEHIYGKVFCQ